MRDQIKAKLEAKYMKLENEFYSKAYNELRDKSQI